MLGKLIEDIILCNTKIWHMATQLKDSSGKLRKNLNMTVQERVKVHTEIRIENAKRSQLRYEIDKLVDSSNAVMDTKINYLEKE